MNILMLRNMHEKMYLSLRIFQNEVYFHTRNTKNVKAQKFVFTAYRIGTEHFILFWKTIDIDNQNMRKYLQNSQGPEK